MQDRPEHREGVPVRPFGISRRISLRRVPGHPANGVAIWTLCGSEDEGGRAHGVAGYPTRTGRQERLEWLTSGTANWVQNGRPRPGSFEWLNELREFPITGLSTADCVD